MIKKSLVKMSSLCSKGPILSKIHVYWYKIGFKLHFPRWSQNASDPPTIMLDFHDLLQHHIHVFWFFLGFKEAYHS
jgi:hypothetical protein